MRRYFLGRFNGFFAFIGIVLISLGIGTLLWGRMSAPREMTLQTKDTILANEVLGKYVLHITYPQITNPSTSQQMANMLIATKIQRLQDEFITSSQNDIGQVPVASESSLLITYQTYLLSNDAISVQFLVGNFPKGAAHPFASNEVFNYSFLKHKEITLPMLFDAKTKYLAFLASAVKKDLARQDKETGNDYSSFLPENMENETFFQKFVLTHDAIIFLFDPGITAPNVLGTRKVSIPYVSLQKYFVK